MQESAIGTTINVDPMVEDADTLLDLLATKVESLKLVDKERGLYTLTASKSKVTRVFPPTFSGQVGENIYRFTKDFEEAILANQVREADKVKTLRKHLAGEAKQKIGDHHKDVKAALGALIEYFRNPKLIWKRAKGTYEKAVGNYVKD